MSPAVTTSPTEEAAALGTRPLRLQGPGARGPEAAAGWPQIHFGGQMLGARGALRWKLVSPSDRPWGAQGPVVNFGRGLHLT